MKLNPNVKESIGVCQGREGSLGVNWKEYVWALQLDNRVRIGYIPTGILAL